LGGRDVDANPWDRATGPLAFRLRPTLPVRRFPC